MMVSSLLKLNAGHRPAVRCLRAIAKGVGTAVLILTPGCSFLADEYPAGRAAARVDAGTAGTSAANAGTAGITGTGTVPSGGKTGVGGTNGTAAGGLAALGGSGGAPGSGGSAATGGLSTTGGTAGSGGTTTGTVVTGTGGIDGGTDGGTCTTSQIYSETGSSWAGGQVNLDATAVAGALVLALSATSGTYLVTVNTSSSSNSGATFTYTAVIPAGTNIVVDSQSSPDGVSWPTNWDPLGSNGKIASPMNQYLRIRITLSTSNTTSPQLRGWSLNVCTS